MLGTFRRHSRGDASRRCSPRSWTAFSSCCHHYQHYHHHFRRKLSVSYRSRILASSWPPSTPAASNRIQPVHRGCQSPPMPPLKGRWSTRTDTCDGASDWGWAWDRSRGNLDGGHPFSPSFISNTQTPLLVRKTLVISSSCFFSTRTRPQSQTKSLLESSGDEVKTSRQLAESASTLPSASHTSASTVTPLNNHHRHIQEHEQLRGDTRPPLPSSSASRKTEEASEKTMTGKFLSRVRPTAATQKHSNTSNIPLSQQQKHRIRVAYDLSQHWLKEDPTWQEATWQHLSSLNITTTFAFSPIKKWESSSSLNGRKNHRLPWPDDEQFYLDSVESFTRQVLLREAHYLKGGSSSSFTLGTTTPLQRVLDEMVLAGFHQPHFSQDYLRVRQGYQYMTETAAEYAALQQRVTALLRQQNDAMIKHQNHQKQFQDWKVQMGYQHINHHANSNYTNGNKPTSKDSFPSFMDALWGSFRLLYDATSSFFSATNKPTAPRDNKIEIMTTFRVQKQWEKRLGKQRRNLDEHESKLQRTQAKLEELKHHRDSIVASLKAPQYQTAHEVMERIRPVICEALAQHMRSRYGRMMNQYKALDAKTDLTRPHEWFPRARLDKRKIIFHAGPTNSGKTYQALERLKQVKKGLYLAPLRLLAAEVYEKLTTDGIYCNLYTGQERREIPFATHGAATMEMATLVDDFDCIVIDEIQMMADKDRGFAWTRALLGSRCPEIHLCGGREAIELVKRIAKQCGDDLTVRYYQRFTPLHVAPRSLAHSSDQLGAYARNVRPGDCVVAFSRSDIFAIKREIEENSAYKCCVIYGSLPPQTRSEQARLFNDPDSGFDILVASDAIGMGLNLNIRRIIFNSIFKHDGSGIVRLGHSAVKQISGRAGRRNSPYPHGEVTCRDPADMPHIRRCMSSEIEPIRRAGLLPTANHIELFSDALEQHGLAQDQGFTKSKKLHITLKKFSEMATVKSDYFLCRVTPMMEIAKHLASLELPVRDKYTLCMCPVEVKTPDSLNVVKRFAAKLAAGEVAGLTRTMIPRKPDSFDMLARLCGVYSELELFLWLQKKFPPGNMMEQQAALARKELAIKYIGESLASTDKLKLDHCYVRSNQRLRAIWEQSEDAESPDSTFDSEDDEDWNKGVEDV